MTDQEHSPGPGAPQDSGATTPEQPEQRQQPEQAQQPDPERDEPQGDDREPQRNTEDDGARSPRVIVAGPSGLGIVEQHERRDPTAVVQEPAKVMRLGSMIKQLLEEVRSAPLDEAARERMARVHERSVAELESGLSEELIEELHRITLPFTEDQTPSDAELRIAQAQLVGWLEGLFHGIQTALVAQQMASQSQLTQMRKGLPPGATPPNAAPPGLLPNKDDDHRGTGQYL